MAFEMSNTQEFDLTLHAVNRLGGVAAVEDVVFTSSDPFVLTVVQNTEDETKATARANPSSPGGAVTVRFVGDADLGDGVEALAGSFDVIVNPARATSFQATASVAREQAP